MHHAHMTDKFDDTVVGYYYAALASQRNAVTALCNDATTRRTTTLYAGSGPEGPSGSTKIVWPGITSGGTVTSTTVVAICFSMPRTPPAAARCCWCCCYCCWLLPLHCILPLYCTPSTALLEGSNGGGRGTRLSIPRCRPRRGSPA
jgi:hypothetical protein